MHRGVRRHGAALGLLLLAVACSSGSTSGAAPTPAVTTVVQTAEATATIPITTAPTVSATRTAAATPKPGSKDFGFLTGVVSKKPVVLSFDRALFLTGEEAVKASKAHGGNGTVPNDYYIVNDNKLLRNITVAADAEAVGSLEFNSFVKKDDYSVDPKKHTVAELVAFLSTTAGQRTPWHLTYGAGGVVTRVEEQYVP